MQSFNGARHVDALDDDDTLFFRSTSAFTSSRFPGVTGGIASRTPFRFAAMRSECASLFAQDPDVEERSQTPPATASRQFIPPLRTPLFSSSLSADASTQGKSFSAAKGFSEEHSVAAGAKTTAGPAAQRLLAHEFDASPLSPDFTGQHIAEEIAADNVTASAKGYKRCEPMADDQLPPPQSANLREPQHPTVAGMSPQPRRVGKEDTSFLAHDDLQFARSRLDSVGSFAAERHGRYSEWESASRETTHGSTPSRGVSSSHGASKSPSTTGKSDGASSSTKEIAQKYFTIVRQVQQQGDSPLSRGSAEAAANPSIINKHDVKAHPQQHLISRKFHLLGDVEDCKCYIRRDGHSDCSQEEAGEAVFSCSPEISSLVNIGDVALCRLIDVRTQLSVEQEAYLHLCHATSALTSVLPDSLHLVKKTQTKPIAKEQQRSRFDSPPRRAADVSGAEEAVHAEGTHQSSPGGHHSRCPSSIADEDGNGSVDLSASRPSLEKIAETLSLLKELTSDGPAMQAIDDMIEILDHHRRKPYLTDELLIHLQKALLLLTEECHGASLSSLDSDVDTVRGVRQQWKKFDLSDLMQEVTLQQQREEEAKQQGNLVHGASSRRELLHILHDGLQLCLSELMRLHPTANGSGDADESHLHTESLIDDMCKAFEKKFTDSRRRLQEVEEACQAAKDAVQELERDRLTLRIDHQRTMEANEQSIVATLQKIDELYGTLESLVNSRSGHVKDFIQSLGSNVLRVDAQSKELSTLEKEAKELQKGSDGVEARIQQVSLLTKVKDLIPVLRSGVAKKVAEHENESAETRSALGVDAVRVASMLRHNVGQWVETLLRNSQREAERAATLVSRIREATDRYHQEDVDLLKGQLDETLARKKKMETEAEELERMIKNDERLASKVIPDFAAAAMAAASTYGAAAAAAGSRPASGYGTTSFGSPQPTPRDNVSYYSDVPQQPLFGNVNSSVDYSSNNPWKTPAKQHLPPSHGHNCGNYTGGQSASRLHEFVQSPMPPQHPSHQLPLYGAQGGFRSPPPVGTVTTLVLVNEVDDSSSHQYRHGSDLLSTPRPDHKERRRRRHHDSDRPVVVGAETIEDGDDGNDTGDTTTFSPLSVQEQQPDYRVQDDADGREGCLPQHPPTTELLDMDQLTVHEFVPLFKKSEQVTRKWIAVLEDIDVETLGDVREMKQSAEVWSGVLNHVPLLKAQLTLILEDPAHFVEQ